MHATIRSYHGVDQNRTAELTTKVKETLVPKLSELPGFAGYYLVDAGNGIFTSLGLFETREQGEQSTKLVSKWIRDEKLDGADAQRAQDHERQGRRSQQRARPGRVAPAAPHPGEGPACRALSLGLRKLNPAARKRLHALLRRWDRHL